MPNKKSVITLPNWFNFFFIRHFVVCRWKYLWISYKIHCKPFVCAYKLHCILSGTAKLFFNFLTKKRTRRSKGTDCSKWGVWGDWNSLTCHLSTQSANFHRHQFVVKLKVRVTMCQLLDIHIQAKPATPPFRPFCAQFSAKFTLILARTHFAYWSAAISEGCSAVSGGGVVLWVSKGFGGGSGWGRGAN